MNAAAPPAEMLQLALKYAADGFEVFPCDPETKKPLCTNGFKAATADEVTIRIWWHRHPAAMVGWPTEGFLVLDADQPQGPDSLKKLEAEIGPLPQTMTVRTPRGGTHYIFKSDEPVKCSASGIGVNLDIRGDGGYIILAGSITATGKRYEVLVDAPPAPAPIGLVKNANSCKSGAANRLPTPPSLPGSGSTPYGQAALNAEVYRISTAPEGSRNACLNAAAFSLGTLIAAGELVEGEAVEGLTEAAQEAGLTDAEISRTIGSGLEAGKLSPRLPPDPGKIFAASAPAGAAGPWIAEALKNGSISRFIDASPPALNWIFRDSLLARTTGLIVGPGAAGKSTLALETLMAVATGRDILPGVFSPAKAGKVLGVFGEDDETVLHHRIHQLTNQLFGFDRVAQDLLRRNLAVVSATGRDIRFIGQSSKHLAESVFFGEIFAALKGITDLELIVLDPIARFHGLEENDNGAGTFLITLMERLAQETGAAVIALHHVSKRAGITPAGFDLEAAMHPDAGRGASGLTNAVRWQCNLFGIPEKDCKRLIGVTDARPGQFLALRVSKKNFGPPEDIRFLERGTGGVLRPFERAERPLAADLDELVRGLVFDAVAASEGRFLTRRVLIDGNCRAWKDSDPRITRPVIEQTISACILRGELVELQGKNGSGKTISYLSKPSV